jgi:alpha/beta superfamily hydrolase
MTEGLTFVSTDGLTLEAELDRADGASGTVVICHPHPKMGGTMNAPLLIALRDDLVPRGWNVLRFNFRGIGSSEGTSSTGSDELQDAAGALVHARTLGAPITLAGWSFGAAVALRVSAVEESLLGCVAIAPAIDEKPGITEGVPSGVEPLCPVLLVVGANDELVEPQRVRQWATDHGASFNEMKGANHFFWAKYDALTSAIGDWLDARR